MRVLHLKEKWLKELGLINKGGFDMFQDRIVISICNRYGQVIGFTARIIESEKAEGKDDSGKEVHSNKIYGNSISLPKYLNSADSIIYHKRESLFGIETAWHPLQSIKGVSG